MANWDKYKNEADSYLRVATGFFKKEKFGAQVVYNMLSMSIENYLTALCFEIKEMPEHSGIVELLNQVDEKIEIPASFKDEVAFVNSFMNLCSLEVLEMKNPSHNDLKRMLDFTERLKDFCDKKLQ